jgi:protein gp37
MADKTLIAWTDHTLNPWMGCFKVSQGCTNCYADALTSGRMGLDVFGHDTSKRQRTSAALWNRPRRWERDALQGELGARGKGPHMVFCASLADVFEDAPGPNEWRKDLWQLIHDTPYLDWQLLTKRPENIARMLPDTWGDNQWGYWPNVWLGTSIEDNRVAERGPILTAVPAVIHFVSYEPAIGPLDELDLDGIEWMIVGGESGPGYRKMDLEWAKDMRRRCEQAGVAFFFKQNHGARTEMGIDALGEIVRHYPEAWDRTAKAVA